MVGVLDACTSSGLPISVVDLLLVLALHLGHELPQLGRRMRAFSTTTVATTGAGCPRSRGVRSSRASSSSRSPRGLAHRHADHQLEVVEVAVPRPGERVLAARRRWWRRPGGPPRSAVRRNCAQAEVGAGGLEGDAHVRRAAGPAASVTMPVTWTRSPWA